MGREFGGGKREEDVGREFGLSTKGYPGKDRSKRRKEWSRTQIAGGKGCRCGSSVFAILAHFAGRGLPLSVSSRCLVRQLLVPMTK